MSLQALHILLVDDNHHMRSLTSAILQSAGCRNLLDATDGGQALKMMTDKYVDLVIVDFNMKPMDGVEFTRMVRSGVKGIDPYLPIIMMTGHSERPRVEEARDAGVTEFVVKPITAKSILDRLQVVILRPRPFVKTGGYFGPDRRRRNTPDYAGPLRRAADPQAGQAG